MAYRSGCAPRAHPSVLMVRSTGVLRDARASRTMATSTPTYKHPSRRIAARAAMLLRMRSFVVARPSLLLLEMLPDDAPTHHPHGEEHGRPSRRPCVSNHGHESFCGHPSRRVHVRLVVPNVHGTRAPQLRMRKRPPIALGRDPDQESDILCRIGLRAGGRRNAYNEERGQQGRRGPARMKMTFRHVSPIGVHSTWSMRVAPVASMTSRSKPSAIPDACGMTAKAARKSSSIG